MNSALEVENVLTESIGFLYSNRKDNFSHYKLVEDIIADLTFDKKIKILKKNIDFEFGVFKKYNSIIKDLNKIREIRNQIAHRNISYPWIFDENDIDENDYNFLTEKYIDWKEKCDFQKPGKDDFSFSLEDLENYQKKCELIIVILRVGISELLSPNK
ncbi:MAG: hypothetical protein KAJ28_05220 [Flavobacteriaceae bacterium]|nr:hypothetical protein [Flavobacteriaceae bacterium]